MTAKPADESTLSFDRWWAIVSRLVTRNDLKYFEDTLRREINALIEALATLPVEVEVISVPPGLHVEGRADHLLETVTMLQAAAPSVAWRVEQLSSALIDAIDNRNITVAALSGRAILELAASAYRDADLVESRWQGLRFDQEAAINELADPSGVIRKSLNHFFFGTRSFVQWEDSDPRINSKRNVVTDIDRVDRKLSKVPFRELYDGLSEAAHPNLESASQHWASTGFTRTGLRRERVSRIPPMQGEMPEALVTTLLVGLTISRNAWTDFAWVAVDAQLRHARHLPRKYLTVRVPKALGALCPCGSHMPFIQCGHDRASFGYVPDSLPAKDDRGNAT